MHMSRNQKEDHCDTQKVIKVRNNANLQNKRFAREIQIIEKCNIVNNLTLSSSACTLQFSILPSLRCALRYLSRSSSVRPR
jgi:lantibiotic modifying enzyme